MTMKAMHGITGWTAWAIVATGLALSAAPAWGQHHTADSDQDGFIRLNELLRIIQFYNVGAFHACPGQGTEDGFCLGNP